VSHCQSILRKPVTSVDGRSHDGSLPTWPMKRGELVGQWRG